MPGVTYEQTVQFTPHGPVVLSVITAPKPDPAGLYQLAPVLGRTTVTGGRERVTQIEKDVSSRATVAGINGDFFDSTRRAAGGDLPVRRRARASAALDPLVDRRRLEPARCTSTASSSSARGAAPASAGR